MPILEGRVDIIPDIDWDTYEAKAGEYQPTRIKLFSKPISRDKSLNKTSMHLANMFPEPIHKNVTNLQVAFAESNHSKDMELFKRYCRYDFRIGSKSYDYGPMSRFEWWNNSNLSLSEIKNLADVLGVKFIGNDVEYRIGDNPIGHHILQAQQFFFDLIFDDIEWCPIEDFSMVVFLKGIKARGVY